MIFADVSMMEKVIRNLIGNAVKFTPENGFIIVQITKKDQGLILEFTNNGPVVTDEIANWINQPTEGNGLLLRPVKSGLGLAIVKRILELHNYSFQVTTGKNNRFLISMDLSNQL